MLCKWTGRYEIANTKTTAQSIRIAKETYIVLLSVKFWTKIWHVDKDRSRSTYHVQYQTQQRYGRLKIGCDFFYSSLNTFEPDLTGYNWTDLNQKQIFIGLYELTLINSSVNYTVLAVSMSEKQPLLNYRFCLRQFLFDPRQISAYYLNFTSERHLLAPEN